MSEYNNDAQPTSGSNRRFLIRGRSGGSHPGSQDPIDIRGDGKVVGLGRAEVLDKDGQVIQISIYGSELAFHNIRPLRREHRN